MPKVDLFQTRRYRTYCPGLTLIAPEGLVLDDGRVVGLGTHEQLSRECREYREVLAAEKRREQEFPAIIRGGA